MTGTSKKMATPQKKAPFPSIEKEIVIKASVEKVWAELTDLETIRGWMGDENVKVNLKVGGKYALFGGSRRVSSLP